MAGPLRAATRILGWEAKAWVALRLKAAKLWSQYLWVSLASAVLEGAADTMETSAPLGVRCQYRT